MDVPNNTLYKTEVPNSYNDYVFLSCHIRLQSKSSLCECVNVKGRPARNRYHNKLKFNSPNELTSQRANKTNYWNRRN